MSTQKLRITGMTCDHCARTIEKSLNALPGVQAKVSYDETLAYVETSERIEPQRLLKAVRAKGYGASLLDQEHSTLTGSGENSLQVAILGSGSAAFACAIRAAEEGAQVTVVESATLGGTCVNVGCVPSKIMIRGAQVAHLAAAHAFPGIQRHAHAIDAPGLSGNSRSASRSYGRPSTKASWMRTSISISFEGKRVSRTRTRSK